MALAMQQTVFSERREEQWNNTDELWQHLTLAQKFSASNLMQFGYVLSFIRDYHNTHIAILTCNDNIAVISKVGEINTQPNIEIRL
jgi:hypothetical protein